MYTLSPVTPADLPTLYRLAEKIWLPTFAPLFTKEELMSLYHGMYNDEALLKSLNKAEYGLYFICRKGKSPDPLGYLAIEWQKDALKLDKIYVDPELQGQGIGAWALAEIAEMASREGVHTITLRVNRRNQQAIQFYLHKGFTIDAEVDFPAPNGFVYDDYLMSKNQD